MFLIFRYAVAVPSINLARSGHSVDLGGLPIPDRYSNKRRRFLGRSILRDTKEREAKRGC